MYRGRGGHLEIAEIGRTSAEGASQAQHLFISYAGEDGHFASWLATNLSRRGYLVWIDKHKLLGGESFPRDIEIAINDRSFRVLGLMSKSSVSKPNPRKERVMAEKVAKKSAVDDFLIPLKVDDISPDDFDFTTTDRSAIDFSKNWATGLAALLKKLQSINCPVSTTRAHEALRRLAAQKDLAISGPEKVISNFLPIAELPKKLFGYKIGKKRLPSGQRVCCRRDDVVWFLQPLKASSGRMIKPAFSVTASSTTLSYGIVPRHILKNLLEKTINKHCVRKGLEFDGEDLYFPLNLLEKNKIKYPSLSGRQTWILVNGVKTASYTNDTKNQFRYFIVPTFWVILDRFKDPVVRVGIRVRNTDMSQRSLSVKDAFRKRKKTTKTWRNKQWLTKHLGLAHWLTGGRALKFFEGDQTFEIGGTLAAFPAAHGIDEAKLEPPDIVNVFGDAEDGGDDA